MSSELIFIIGFSIGALIGVISISIFADVRIKE